MRCCDGGRIRNQGLAEGRRGPRDEDLSIELGLIYDIRIEEKDDGTHAEIDMTLTSPGCPVAPELMSAVHRSALATEGIESVHVNLTFSPLWDPRVHSSEDAQMDMGIF